MLATHESKHQAVLEFGRPSVTNTNPNTQQSLIAPRIRCVWASLCCWVCGGVTMRQPSELTAPIHRLTWPSMHCIWMGGIKTDSSQGDRNSDGNHCSSLTMAELWLSTESTIYNWVRERGSLTRLWPPTYTYWSWEKEDTNTWHSWLPLTVNLRDCFSVAVQ